MIRPLPAPPRALARMLHTLRMLPLILLALLLPLEAAHADPIKFARWPHVSEGKLVFSYQGDIWVANRDGADPRRITSHVADDTRPRFSPDGRWIAFTSNRAGASHVYVVPTSGGEPRQLTFHPAGDNVQYWTPDGSAVMVSTSRGIHPFMTPLHLVPLDGSIPVPMAMDGASAGMIRQDGGMVAFNRKGFSFTRKGYQGNNAADLWVQDLATGEFLQLTNIDVQGFREQGHDALPMWGADGMIYFVSERGNGPFNLWRIASGGGAPQQVTFHSDDGIQYPSISPDGRTVAYTHAFELWTLDLSNPEPRRVALELKADPRGNLEELHTFRSRAQGYAPSPDGRLVAVDMRGRIFIVPSEEGVGEIVPVTQGHARNRNQAWSPDGRHLAYVSDASGDEEIWLYTLATRERRKLTTHESTKASMVWSADSRRIAFDAANSLFLIEVESGTVAELAHNEAGGYSLQEFSTDGKWLVYTRRDEEMNAEVFLFDIDARREVNLTRDPFNALGGRLTPDQRTVVFLSNRDGGTNHLFAVHLARLADDPADPVVRERLARARGDEGGNGGRGDATPAAAPIRIDEEGIARRAIQLTSGSESVSSYFISADGRTVHFLSSDSDGPGIFAVGIDGRGQRRVTGGRFLGMTPTFDRKMVFYQEAGGNDPGVQVHRMTLQNQKKERVEFTVPVWVDLRREYSQILDESWRVMKYRFYDAGMHGKDWDEIRDRYRTLLPFVSTYNDLYDVANKMLGELNASHIGVSGPSSRPQPADFRPRYLGFEMEPGEGGRYRVSHVFRDGPADREWLDISVGDYILALEREELHAGDNYWRTLTRLVNDYVTVRVASTPDGRNAREMRMATVPSLNDIRYEEWVESRRDYVEQASGGRIAYVHIRAMNQPSLRRFENEIDRFWQAEGIVVDIRYNGGGNIDQQLIDILERRPYQFWNQRWGARTWGRRPRQAIAGPKVMLINHRSGSDAEVTPLGFQQLGLGSLVGNPTAGAVIATGSYQLIHGGSIRTPGSLVVTWDPTQPNNYGINLENYGVAPDVWVENSPADELGGFDRELKAAVDEALRMLRAEEALRAADAAGREP